MGQGALAVECREADLETITLLKPLFDSETALRIIAERSFLRTLGGGCSAPVAVTTKILNNDLKSKIILQGAVWSLDGRDELIEEDESIVEVAMKRTCKNCICSEQKQHSNCESTKRVSDCSDCPFSAKRQKRNEQNAGISLELLKNDPHESCPVELPVGVDFMGKCPYLEQLPNNIERKCPVNAQIEGTNGADVTKCPFMRDGKLEILPPPISSQENSNLYCGLVLHEEVPKWALDEAQDLGARLAKKLMLKGASDIMNKAQAHIRNN